MFKELKVKVNFGRVFLIYFNLSFYKSIFWDNDLIINSLNDKFKEY